MATSPGYADIYSLQQQPSVIISQDEHEPIETATTLLGDFHGLQVRHTLCTTRTEPRSRCIQQTTTGRTIESRSAVGTCTHPQSPSQRPDRKRSTAEPQILSRLDQADTNRNGRRTIRDDEPRDISQKRQRRTKALYSNLVTLIFYATNRRRQAHKRNHEVEDRRMEASLLFCAFGDIYHGQHYGYKIIKGSL